MELPAAGLLDAEREVYQGYRQGGGSEINRPVPSLKGQQGDDAKSAQRTQGGADIKRK